MDRFDDLKQTESLKIVEQERQKVRSAQAMHQTIPLKIKEVPGGEPATPERQNVLDTQGKNKDSRPKAQTPSVKSPTPERQKVPDTKGKNQAAPPKAKKAPSGKSPSPERQKVGVSKGKKQGTQPKVTAPSVKSRNAKYPPKKTKNNAPSKLEPSKHRQVGSTKREKPAPNKLAKAQAAKSPAKITMADRRKAIVDAIFSDKRISSEKEWNQVDPKYRGALGTAISTQIAKGEGSPPLTIQTTTKQQTGLYQTGSQMVGRINVKDAMDRKEFAILVGQINLARFQKLGFEDLNRYPELYTEAVNVRENDGKLKTVELGKVNYSDAHRLELSLKNSPENRMDIRTNATMLLARDISKRYASECKQEENDREIRPGPSKSF